jgi:hypothetical protein
MATVRAIFICRSPSFAIPPPISFFPAAKAGSRASGAVQLAAFDMMGVFYPDFRQCQTPKCTGEPIVISEQPISGVSAW